MNIREAIRQARRLKEEINTAELVEPAEPRRNQEPAIPKRGESSRPAPDPPEITHLIEPYADRTESLVIPYDCPLKYRWWAGGQSIVDTLAELGLAREVWELYTERPYPEKTGFS